RTQQERRWNREAQRPGGLAADGQLELRGLLDRKVARFRTLEDPIDVRGRSLIEVRVARSVAQQSSDVHVLLGRKNRRQPVLRGELGDQWQIRLREAVECYDDGLGMLLRGGVEGAGQLLGASNVEQLRLHTERPRRSLRHAPLNRENRVAQVEEPRDSGELRKQLLEELDAFGIDLDVEVAEPRDVSARAPEAGDEAGPDRITAGGHDHWNGLGRVPCRQRGRRSPRQDQIYLQIDQLARSEEHTSE